MACVTVPRCGPRLGRSRGRSGEPAATTGAAADRHAVGQQFSRPIAHRVGYRIAGTTVTWWVNEVSDTGEKVCTGVTATTVDCPAGG